VQARDHYVDRTELFQSIGHAATGVQAGVPAGSGVIASNAATLRRGRRNREQINATRILS
jgi:hypothetical protein